MSAGLVRLHAVSESVFGWLASTSWDVSIVVLGVLALQVLLGRILSPRVLYGLWLLVALRLVVPALPELPLGGAAPVGIPSAPWEAAARTHRAPTFEADVTRPPGSRARSVEPAEPPTAGAGTEPARERRAARAERPRASAGHAAPIASETADSLPAAPLPWRTALVGIWLAVALAMGLRLLLADLAFRRRIAHAPPLERGRLADRLASCAALLGMRRTPRVVLTGLLTSPALYGCFRPRLLIPGDGLERFGAAEVDHVLLHELAHYKRRDVAVNVLVALLACTFWFHPLLRFAFARLRAAQESARDWEALCAASSPAPVRYASTLMKLLDSEETPVHAAGFLGASQDLRRRIRMIATYRTPTRTTRLAGGACLVLASWATFTSAAPAPIAPRDEPTPSQRRSVRVERQHAAPAWKQQLEALLAAEFAASFQDVEFGEIAEWLRTLTGANVVIDPDFNPAFDGSTFSIEAESMTVRAFLDRLTQVVDEMGWCLVDEVVFIGERDSLPEPLELRFYRVEPLLEDADDDVVSHENLMDIIRNVVADTQHTWDLEGRSVEYWNGLLVIMQTEAAHRRIESFLNRLLNRGVRGAGDDLAWRAEMDAKLSEPTELRAEDMPAADVARLLTARHGLYVQVDEDLCEEPITLTLGGVRLGSALNWIANAIDTRVVVTNGMVRLADDWADPTLEFYDLGGLFERSPAVAEDDVRVTLQDMMYVHLDPDSWDSCPLHGVVFWRDQMLVTQQPEVQAQIVGLIQAVERALASGR